MIPVCHQEIPTKLKIDITQMGRLCPPRLFRSMHMKDAVDDPPTPFRPPRTWPAFGFLCTLRPSSFKHWLLSVSAWGQNPSRTEHREYLPGHVRLPSTKERWGLEGEYPSLPHTLKKQFYNTLTWLPRRIPPRLSPRCLMREGPQ